MRKTRVRTLLQFFALSTVVMTAASCKTAAAGSDRNPFFNRRDAAFSSQGSVYEGARAYSPDGKFYACETKPYGTGCISVYGTKAKNLVHTWNVLPNSNDLKGLAWSPDSKKIAVMYHGGMTPGIMVISLTNKSGTVGSASISQWFHFMVWSRDNKTLLLSESRGSVTKIVPTMGR